MLLRRSEELPSVPSLVEVELSRFTPMESGDL
jgi:hypothetical protein